MKPYLLSLGAGMLVGIVYSLLGVRSPAPPVIALVGLAGILAGEQVVPAIRHGLAGHSVVAFIEKRCLHHVLGRLPANCDQDAG
ncbi:hypothetical protein Y88_3185 [Novosphingobium nitrogenifigens DSM 19370]|uniref:XapX domain-containing protein n=1 Tax=Novosphingobium nitrogenifigens DSM 19370 TaxID=983920 RepID=F1ZC04_9SPHN|nr:XapX domain-containing protein [Novosphingobium nitrogenifigens]EGD57858.1 hypothetical protein Y88_3185 [Novosphingobium nitrogenifigens DSM 19370]